MTLVELEARRDPATMTPVARRAAALAAATAAATAGKPLTAAELGRRFGMSRTWARDVLRDLPAAADGHPSVTERPAAATHVPSHPAPEPQERPRGWLDTSITLAVALVAAAASYGHMYDVALAAGEPVWIARAWPITVDGLALAGLRRGRAGQGWLILGLAVSVAANIVAQFPDLAASPAAGIVIAGWPPIALYGTHQLLHRKDRP